MPRFKALEKEWAPPWPNRISPIYIYEHVFPAELRDCSREDISAGVQQKSEEICAALVQHVIEKEKLTSPAVGLDGNDSLKIAYGNFKRFQL